MSETPEQYTYLGVSYNKGSATSEAAARSMVSRAKTDEARVLAYITAQGPYGAISDEAEAALGMSHQNCSARFNGLWTAGRIIRLDVKRATRSGRLAFVHVAARAEVAA